MRHASALCGIAPAPQSASSGGNGEILTVWTPASAASRRTCVYKTTCCHPRKCRKLESSFPRIDWRALLRFRRGGDPPRKDGWGCAETNSDGGVDGNARRCGTSKNGRSGRYLSGVRLPEPAECTRKPVSSPARQSLHLMWFPVHNQHKPQQHGYRLGNRVTITSPSP